MKPIVCISLGGSIIAREDGINLGYVRKLKVLLKSYSKKYKFVLVVGGGYPNKLYVNSIKEAIPNNSLLDQIGIAFTRINALIVKDLLLDLDIYPNVVTSLEELKMAINRNNIAVIGGLLTGISTDAVALLSCEVVNGKNLINVSSSAYIYDRPPSEKGAVKLTHLTHQKLIEIAYMYDTREARSNFIFDFVASKLAKRANIKIRLVDDSIPDLKLAIDGKFHKGSIVG
jgi:uridylate kinase